jgi:deoxyadenosine/deoxycytidine kinase
VTKRSSSKFLTIAIEGNIASGKSTVVRKLADLHQVTTFLEPLPFWQNVGADQTNLLDLFYQDQIRWFALLQSFISLTFLRIHDEEVRTQLKVCERSFFSADAFIEQMLQTTNVHPVDAHLIQAFREELREEVNGPDYFIYLRISPLESYARLKLRARNEEASVPYEYLRSLNEHMDNWLLSDSRTFTVDANQNRQVVYDQVRSIVLRLQRDWQRNRTKSFSYPASCIEPCQSVQTNQGANDSDDTAESRTSSQKYSEDYPRDVESRLGFFFRRARVIIRSLCCCMSPTEDEETISMDTRRPRV